MSYSFPAELQRLIQVELATGNYVDEDELLLYAMQALQERKEEIQQWKAEVHGRIEALNRGEGIELEDERALRAFADDIKSEGRRAYETDGNSP